MDPPNPRPSRVTPHLAVLAALVMPCVVPDRSMGASPSAERVGTPAPAAAEHVTTEAGGRSGPPDEPVAPPGADDVDAGVETDDVGRRVEAPVGGVGAMSVFDGLAGSAWQMGNVQVDTWSWGPGRRSVRVHTVGADGGGGQWRELALYYWHPRWQQIRIFGQHPDIPGLGRGVSEGILTFDGTTGLGRINLHQPGHPAHRSRTLAVQWAFDRPDRYRETLLEDDGRGMKELASWSHTRAAALEMTPGPGPVGRPSAELDPLVPLLGQWRARGVAIDGASSEAVVRTPIEVEIDAEWLDLLDVVEVRLVVRGGTSDDTIHAYLHHHVGSGDLRCLALSSTGRVSEGRIRVLDGGALAFDLETVGTDQEWMHRLHLAFEDGGVLRARARRGPAPDGAPVLELQGVRSAPPGADH